MTRALAVLTGGAFLTLALGVVGAGESALVLLLGAVFVVLGTVGFAWVQRRGWAWAYLAVQLPLAVAIFMIDAGVGSTLFLVVLVSQCVLLFPLPVTAVVIALVPFVHVGMPWVDGLREGFGTLAAVVFVHPVSSPPFAHRRAEGVF